VGADVASDDGALVLSTVGDFVCSVGLDVGTVGALVCSVGLPVGAVGVLVLCMVGAEVAASDGAPVVADVGQGVGSSAGVG